MTLPAGSTPATTGSYQFTLELCDAAGQNLEDVPLTFKDFERAVYATWFEGYRSEQLADYAPVLAEARIEPVFSGEDRVAAASSGRRANGPAVPHARTEAFEVEVGPGGGSHRMRFGSRYFRTRAIGARQRLHQDDQPADEQVLFQVSAYWDDPQAAQNSNSTISLGPASIQLKIREVSRGDLGTGRIWDPNPAGLLPVLIEQCVIDDVLAETAAAPEREIGGFLLGHLARDPKTRELYVWITGSVAGSDTTDGDSTSVTYTPETFALGRRMIQLRGEGESILGWYHSHPFRFCSECPLPTPVECIDKVLFYSQDDIQLMETTFDQPFMVGLLSAVEPKIQDVLGHAPVRLYGWQEGTVQQREFEVIDSDPD